MNKNNNLQKELFKSSVLNELNEMNKFLQIPAKLLKNIDFFENVIFNSFDNSISIGDTAKEIFNSWNEIKKTNEFITFSNIKK
jgi:hypothetical protein